jgi:hypothetical protein
MARDKGHLTDLQVRHWMAGSSAFLLPAHSRSRAARHDGDTHLNQGTLPLCLLLWRQLCCCRIRFDT